MEKPSTARIAIKWGIINGLISIVLYLIMYNTSLWQNTWLSFTLGMAVSITLLYLAIKEFKQSNNGYLKIGEGMGVGILTTAVGAVISTLFQLVYVKFIDTTFYEKQLNMIEEQYIERGMSEEQIEMMLSQVEKFNNSGLTFVFGVLIALIIGAVLSLIIAAIMKKEAPVFE